MSRKRVWLVIKTVAAVVLVAAVGRHFVRLFENADVWERLSNARGAYLVPAGLLYVLAHTIWGTFWVQLLCSQHGPVPWLVGLRAYFVSQFGKYVPGKAWVLILRVGLLREQGISTAVVAVTATYETLTSMAAGAMLGAILLPWAGLGLEWGSGKGLALIGLAGLPLGLGVLHRLGVRIAAKSRGPDAKPLPSPSMALLARGLAQDAVGWLCLGLSLWLTVQAIAHEPTALSVEDYLRDLSAVALSYVLGFVVLFAPGGLGPRELLLQTVLATQLLATEGNSAAAVAAVVAIVLRLVWTVAEVVAAGLLYFLVRDRVPPSSPPVDALVAEAVP